MADCKVTSHDEIRAAWDRHDGNVLAMCRDLNLPRGTVRHHVAKLKLKQKKPMCGGSINGVPLVTLPLPPKGKVSRYICTSAQNNTKVFLPLWGNLLALAKHYDATILVGTFSYNQNAYGTMAVKQGTAKHYDSLWFAKEIKPYISDKRLRLGRALVWCGEMNIQPTATDPLSGLETYSGRYSAIFPHAMISMRSVAAMKGDDAKLNYTTGTVTQKNYIQKKAGLKGEHQHSYGAVLVEISHEGDFWVRQIESSDDGVVYDLGVKVDRGIVTEGNRVEAITWGDLHASQIDPVVHQASVGKGGMLDTLKPKHQFIHDLLNASSMNHHSANDPHQRFRLFCERGDDVVGELSTTFDVLVSYLRKDTQTVVVDSNHDNWFARWLRENDYRRDPKNALLFLEAQTAVYRAIQDNKTLNLLEWAMGRLDYGNAACSVKFLEADESYKVVNGAIECGMHGHLGSNGARGTPKNLYNVGRRANTGHTHTTGIYHGLYVAGTSSQLDLQYNKGPCAWTHSHILTYPNGKRSIIGVFKGRWRA